MAFVASPLSTQHSGKSKDLLARNQDYMYECGDMSIHGLLFQWASIIKKIQLSLLVWYKADLLIISLKINLFSPWYSCKIAELALNYNHSLTYATCKSIYVNISYTYKNQIKTNNKKSLKNHNPLSEEGQTIQWPKEKGQKKKPGSTKHYTET